MEPDFSYDPYGGEKETPPAKQNLVEERSANAAPPEEAPSENVSPPEQADEEENLAGDYELRRPHKASRSLTVTLLILFLIAAGLLLVWRFGFCLESVQVKGLTTRNQEDVIGLAGLVRGRNMFSIDEDTVQASLKKDHTLVFEGMEKDYASHTIYLFVRERKAVAVLYQLGTHYLMDEEGMVLRQISSDEVPDGLPIITGMMGNGLRVGQIISGVTEEQMEAYRQVVTNVLATDGITKVNLKDPTDITAETSGGMLLKLADSSYMSAKLKAYRYIMQFLDQSHRTGVLDLTIPEEAKYSEEH